MSLTVRVLIAAPVEGSLLDLLGSDSRFVVDYSPCASEQEIIARLGAAEILVTRYQNPVGRVVFEHASQLKLVVQGTSGLDNIDEAAATEHGVAVIGTPGMNANAVAELVIGHMIALTRTVGQYDRSLRAGVWNRSDCSDRRELRAFRLGIVGLGRVGGRLAELAHSFSIAVAACDPYLDHERFEALGVSRCSTLEDLLTQSDILSLHVPLTDETRGMIGPPELDLLPSGAFVINTSRGPVLDTDALLERLESNRLRGAALDVFDPEPPTRHEWPDLPSLILTPHIAGCTWEAKDAAARAVYAAIVEWVESNG